MSLMNAPTIADKDKQERDLKNVANIKDKNEKLSWTRRQKKIEEMVVEMQPIEDQILALTAQRQEVLDKIQVLRKQMVKECIHPKNSLVHKETYIECKFCNAKLSIPREK
ncbi:predicted ORF [Xanthomonas phage XacN1]|nr:predicted ORF [Xanthomonas phage XacN1]